MNESTNVPRPHLSAARVEEAVPGIRFQRFPDSSTFRPGEVMPWGSVPVQARGTFNGDPFYFRFRGDHARLTVWGGAPDPGPYSLPREDPTLVANLSEVTGETMEGHLTADEAFEVITRLVGRLQPPSEDNPTFRMQMAKGVAQIAAEVEAGTTTVRK